MHAAFFTLAMCLAALSALASYIVGVNHRRTSVILLVISAIVAAAGVIARFILPSG